MKKLNGNNEKNELMRSFLLKGSSFFQSKLKIGIYKELYQKELLTKSQLDILTGFNMEYKNE